MSRWPLASYSCCCHRCDSLPFLPLGAAALWVVDWPQMVLEGLLAKLPLQGCCRHAHRHTRLGRTWGRACAVQAEAKQPHQPASRGLRANLLPAVFVTHTASGLPLRVLRSWARSLRHRPSHRSPPSRRHACSCQPSFNLPPAWPWTSSSNRAATLPTMLRARQARGTLKAEATKRPRAARPRQSCPEMRR